MWSGAAVWTIVRARASRKDMATLFQEFLNLLQSASMLALAVWLLLLLPLAVLRRARPVVSTATLFISALWGVTLWVTATAVLLNYWGVTGFILGVVLVGVGSLPLAALASAVHGEWGTAGTLLALVLPAWGARLFAGWLASTVEAPTQTE